MKLDRWFSRHFAAKLGAAAIRLLGATIRLRIHDPHGTLASERTSAVLFAFWHNRLFLLPYIHSHVQKGRRLAAMISRSRDGNLITDIIQEFGMDAARGSSSRQGSTALITLIRWLEAEGIDAAITPDGPRGPRQKLQPGILFLSRASGRPIIPLRLEYSAKWELQSWDRFQIPLPFARCDFYVGPPLVVPSEADDAELERIAAAVTEQLGQ